MKYSQQIGIVAAIGLITCCFLPWVFIPSHNITISGMNSNTNYGKPGLLNIIFSTISIILFAISKIWAKRANLFIGTLNLAWSIKNLIVLSSCSMGDCPEKHISIYLQLILAIVMFVMILFPKIKIIT